MDVAAQAQQHASEEQMRAALASAYLAQGVKTYARLGKVFTSAVQHSSARTKAILQDAANRLERKGLAHSFRIVPSDKGDRIHSITF